MLLSKKLVIFDWDGTLLDSSGAVINAHHSAMREVDIPAISSTELEGHLGKPGKTLCQTLCKNTSICANDYYSVFSKFYRENTMHLRLFPHTQVLLQDLRSAGLKIAIATNKPKAIAMRELETTGVLSCFSALEFADQSVAKPDPRMLSDLCKLHQVLPSQAIMIGDQIDDSVASQRAGIDCLIVYDKKLPTWHPQSGTGFMRYEDAHHTIMDRCGLLETTPTT